MAQSTERKLFQYAFTFKRNIMIGLICLIAAVALELTGPFIAKYLIDKHIVGIENTWHQVSGENKWTASYEGDFYVRDDRLNSSGDSLSEASILQVGRSYYFDESVPLTGSRTIDEGVVTIETPDETVKAEAERLAVHELYQFSSRNNLLFTGFLLFMFLFY